MIVYIQESTRPGKKWMAQVREDGLKKTVRFGQRGASDYTINKDDARRASYLARHGGKEDWGRDGVLTPGWLSWWLLWEKRSMAHAIANASTMYGMSGFASGHRFFCDKKNQELQK